MSNNQDLDNISAAENSVLSEVLSDSVGVDSVEEDDAKPTTDDWYTRPSTIEKARQVLGAIDLDPMTSDLAQSVVQAERYFTKAQNGLDQVWRGRIWLNPPYSKPAPAVHKLVAGVELFREVMDYWAERLTEVSSREELVAEVERVALFDDDDYVTSALLLVNSDTSAIWYQAALRSCSVALLFDKRQPHWTPKTGPDKPQKGNRNSQTLFYFGDDIPLFHAAFGDSGSIVAETCRLPMDPHSGCLDLVA